MNDDDEVQQNLEQGAPPVEGYYWVKFKSDTSIDNAHLFWEIAYWRDEEWWERCGIEGEVSWAEVIEIGPYIHKPDSFAGLTIIATANP